METILALIAALSLQYNLDPNLVASIVEVESGFNPNAVGSVGELGLFQLRPEYFGADVADPIKNIRVGIKHLNVISKSCPHVKEFTWVICHNLGKKGAGRIKDPKSQTYYKKVMKNYAARLRKTKDGEAEIFYTVSK